MSGYVRVEPAEEQSAEEQPIDLHTKKWKYYKFLSSVAFKVYTVGKFQLLWGKIKLMWMIFLQKNG